MDRSGSTPLLSVRSCCSARRQAGLALSIPLKVSVGRWLSASALSCCGCSADLLSVGCKSHLLGTLWLTDWPSLVVSLLPALRRFPPTLTPLVFQRPVACCTQTCVCAYYGTFWRSVMAAIAVDVAGATAHTHMCSRHIWTSVWLGCRCRGCHQYCHGSQRR
jgi:hypothetical protein